MSEDLLSRLRAARSVEERDWLVTEALLDSLPSSLQSAVWAAAVPHWFNVEILVTLLDRPRADCRLLYNDLRNLPFVEPFEDRGGYNIHEVTRASILKHLWHEQRNDYIILSARAADYFSKRNEPEWQVEQAYHLLISAPDQGADILRDSWVKYHNTSQYALLFALAQVGLEHSEANRSQGRGRGWTYFLHGQVERRYYRYHQAIEAFRKALQSVDGDRQLEANCIKALGNVNYMLKEYAKARVHYEEACSIYTSIANHLDAANCTWNLGYVHYMLGQYTEAYTYYEAARSIYTTISDRLGEANCYFGLGDIAKEKKDWQQAEGFFHAALSIYREVDAPFNIWLALRRLGLVAEGNGEWAKALRCYREALEIVEMFGGKVTELYNDADLQDMQRVAPK